MGERAQVAITDKEVAAKAPDGDKVVDVVVVKETKTSPARPVNVRERMQSLGQASGVNLTRSFTPRQLLVQPPASTRRSITRAQLATHNSSSECVVVVVRGDEWTQHPAACAAFDKPADGHSRCYLLWAPFDRVRAAERLPVSEQLAQTDG